MRRPTIAFLFILSLIVGSMAQQGAGPGPGLGKPPGGGGSSLDDGLVSFWKLGEATGTTRNDSVGTNHLTDNDSNLLQVPGQIGNAVEFIESGGGGTSYLQVADNASLSITSSWTIVAWVQLNSTASTVSPGIAAKWEVGHRSYALSYSVSLSRFRCLASSDGAATVGVSSDNFGAPSLSTWYFLVCYFDDAADLVGISVNDGTPNTVAFTGSIFDGTAPLNIGRLGSSADIIGADIDAVGLWNRKLPTTEITCLRNGGVGQEPPFAACP